MIRCLVSGAESEAEELLILMTNLRCHRGGGRRSMQNRVTTTQCIVSRSDIHQWTHSMLY